jgi:hypothetical protein
MGEEDGHGGDFDWKERGSKTRMNSDRREGPRCAGYEGGLEVR